MPRRQATRSKLSRRRVGVPSQRALSPEVPFLEPPPDAPDPDPDPDPASAGGRTGTLLAPRTTNTQKIAKGDVVFAKYRGAHYPALVTRLSGKKASVKFVYDLVVEKRGLPFKMQPSACLRFTYEEKKRRREEAQETDLQTREKLLLAIEAVEELENTHAMEPVDDPEEFFKTQCEYIVRLSASASPKKGAADSALDLPSARALPSPPRLSPLAETYGDSEEEEDEDESDEAPSSPPLPPPPPLPPHLREEQCAYAAKLLEVILSKPCARHLRAVHAGKVPSWRRDEFWRGGHRRLVTACSLGDLETYPEMAEKARQEALRLVDRLRGRRPVNRRQYAEEVLAPEAMLFAVSALSAERRSANELEAELSRGLPRFHT